MVYRALGLVLEINSINCHPIQQFSKDICYAIIKRHFTHHYRCHPDKTIVHARTSINQLL